MTITERAAWAIILTLIFGYIGYGIVMGDNMPTQIRGGCY